MFFLSLPGTVQSHRGLHETDDGQCQGKSKQGRVGVSGVYALAPHKATPPRSLWPCSSEVWSFIRLPDPQGPGTVIRLQFCRHILSSGFGVEPG